MSKWKIEGEKGFSILEAMLASSLVIIIVAGLAGALTLGTEGVLVGSKKIRATQLAQEANEAIRSIRDRDSEGFYNLADGVYGLTTENNIWELKPDEPENINEFTRSIVLNSPETDVKEITVTINWQQNLQRDGELQVQGLLTNWRGVGDIIPATWENPVLSASLNTPNNANGTKIQVQGNYAYIVTAATSQNFLVIDVSNPSAPSQVGALNLSGTPNNIFVEGNYAYVASSNANQELQIVNIANPSSPSLTSTLNNPGNNPARGIFKSGDFVYLAIAGNNNNNLVIVDVTNPNSPIRVSGITLNRSPFEVTVEGNYAYLSSDSPNQKIQVVNVSNPSNLTLASTLNLPGNRIPLTIANLGSTLFVGYRESFITVDISNPNSLTVLGEVDVANNQDINDIALNFAENNSLVFLATGASAAELQIIDISDLQNPSVYATYDVTGNNNYLGVAYSGLLDTAVFVGNRAGERILLLRPGEL
jgi:Tfp pilus assembly protein PilV